MSNIFNNNNHTVTTTQITFSEAPSQAPNRELRVSVSPDAIRFTKKTVSKHGKYV